MKRTLMMMTLALAASSLFAAGNSENQDVDQAAQRAWRNGSPRAQADGDWSRGSGYAGHGGMAGAWNVEDLETETLEGTFELVDGLYPAVETANGDMVYLMIKFPLTDEQIPADGAAITAEVLPSPMSPVHMMVFSATVDGETLEPDWDGIRSARGQNGGAMGGRWNKRDHRGMRGNGGFGGGRGFSSVCPFYNSDVPADEAAAQ